MGKLPGGKATPTRLLRSQQQAQAAAAPTGGGGGEGGGAEEGGGDDAEEAEIDPFDLADPVDMLSQMPKDFYEKIVSCLLVDFHMEGGGVCARRWVGL